MKDGEKNSIKYPTRHLLVLSQQRNHEENVSDLLKVNNKATKVTSLTSL